MYFINIYYLFLLRMTQNMFQEGLYQVFVRENSGLPAAATALPGDLRDARMQRWFGTVVGGRVLVTGVPSYFSTVLLLYSPTFLQPYFSTALLFMNLNKDRSVSPPGDPGSRCPGLHIVHGDLLLCELQLLHRHDDTGLVQPLCKLICNTQTQTHT